MKTRYITTIIASALLTAGLIPFGSAQSLARNAPDGIEVITVTGKRPGRDAIELATVRPAPEGIEVLTVVGKRPEPTVASICVNEVIAGRTVSNGSESGFSAQTPESRDADRANVRQAIEDCIEQSRQETHS